MLSGAHTIGVSHCTSFSARLYNFMGKGDQDSSLSPLYATYLKIKCQNLTDYKTTVPVDPISSLSFDTRYYLTLLEKEGLFQSDAALLTDENSLKEVKNLLFLDYFSENFAQSIMKMGAIQVLMGTEGQIRKNGSVVNS